MRGLGLGLGLGNAKLVGRVASAASVIGGLVQAASDAETFTATAAQNLGGLVQASVVMQAANVSLWLRSDLGVTLVSGAVSAWADQSGNANNATQTTAGQRPSYNTSNGSYNNQPTLGFAAASNAVLNLTTKLPAQAFTLLAVCDVTDLAGNQNDIIGDGSTATRVFRSHNSGFWDMFAGSTLASTNNTTSKQAFAGVFNGASSALYINSSASAAISGNVGANNPANVPVIGAQTTAGSANNLNGNLAELVVVSGALSTAQIGQWFSYFASRYSPGSWS